MNEILARRGALSGLGVARHGKQIYPEVEEMNKRIKLLAEQATEEMDQEAFSEDMNIPAEWYQKFAELIVRECIEQIHVADVGDLKGKSYYLDKVAEHVENHFGVEE